MVHAIIGDVMIKMHPLLQEWPADVTVKRGVTAVIDSSTAEGPLNFQIFLSFSLVRVWFGVSGPNIFFGRRTS